MLFSKQIQAMLGLAVSVVLGLSSSPLLAVESQWTITNTHSDWLDDAGWSNGVANNPGDVATILSSISTASLDQDATIGQLTFANSGADVSLQGSGTLLFNNPGTAPALLTVLGSRSHELNVGLFVSDAETLAIALDEDASLALLGSITSASGTISASGEGNLTISGNNSTWGGNLLIDQTTVFATSENALGNTNGSTTVSSGGSLHLTYGTSEDFVLQGGNLGLPGGTVNGTIDLTGDNVIIFSSPLVSGPRRGSNTVPLGILESSITGTGGITYQGQSNSYLRITGNSTYEGLTTLASGEIWIDSSQGLGSSQVGTTIEGGTMRLNVATSEPIRLEDGSLYFNTTEFGVQAPITLAGGTAYMDASSYAPIIVESDNAVLLGSGSTHSWTGGTTGTGNLTLSGYIEVDAPLAHDGNTNFEYVTLNTANYYTGTTTINGFTTVNHADAFGPSTTPIVINGSLVLNEAASGSRDLVVERGELRVYTSTPIESDIQLGVTFDSAIIGNGVFNGTINYNTTPGGGNATISGGTFNGTIQGDTPIYFRAYNDETTILNAANHLPDYVRVSEGRIVVNHSQAIPLPATQITSGRLEMNVPVTGLPWLSNSESALQLNVAQQVADKWYIKGGTLDAQANVTINRILLHNAELASDDNSSITITDKAAVFGESIIGGNLAGDGNLQLAGTSLTIRSDLSKFSGNIIATSGDVILVKDNRYQDIALNPTSEFHIYKGASLQFSVDTDELTIANDIYLHPFQGHSYYDNSASFVGGDYSQDFTLQGRIYTGTHGATILKSFDLEGQLVGQDLQLYSGSLTLHTPQTELVGTLSLSAESLNFEDSGRIAGLSQIELRRGSTIYLSRQSQSFSTNLIADDIPITSFGGRIINAPTIFGSTTETIGKLTLESNLTTLQAAPEALLLVTELDRKPGTLLEFSEHSGTGGVRFLNAPAQQLGMLGAWATTESGFATLNSSGYIETLQSTSTDINTATATDHVFQSDGGLLTADRTIASLNGTAYSNPLDLDGHRLTVRSGGIYSSVSITNGTLTAGDGEDTELVLHGSNAISASIADHPDGGAVSLVTQGGVTLSGHNTYSGDTYVIGERYSSTSSTPVTLSILSNESLPQGGRLFVDGGRLDFTKLTGGTIELSELHLTNSGLISGYYAPIIADVFHVDSGILSAPIAGNGVLDKDTQGALTISDSHPLFTGEVFVRAGSMTMHGQALPNASSIRIEGGMLSASTRALPNDVELAGGELYGMFSGAVDVTSSSSLYARGDSGLYGALSGTGDLTIHGPLDDDYNTHYVAIYGDASDFHGDFHVESGALRIGAPAQMGEVKWTPIIGPRASDS